MIYMAATILVLLNAIWLSFNFFALPGNWLMIASALVTAWLCKSADIISTQTFIIVFSLAVVGEIVEFLSGMVGARKAGASKKVSLAAIAGAIIGGIVGTFIFPFVGSLLGACVLAGFAVWGVEHFCCADQDGRTNAVKRGFGAGIGVFLGMFTKITIGFVIWIIIAVAAFVN